MGLGSEVVDFGWLYFAHQFDEGHGVCHICIMQVEVRLTFEMGDALAVVNG